MYSITANIFFLLIVCTCFFCKVRLRLMLSIMMQNEHSHILGPMGTLCYQQERRAAFGDLQGILYRELGEQVGRQPLTSGYHCWDLQNWWHPHGLITAEQHTDLLLLGTVLWYFLQYGQWNWVGQLKLLVSVLGFHTCDARSIFFSLLFFLKRFFERQSE